MKTVYDLMRHHTSLEVICGNCSHSAVPNNRFLSRLHGMMKPILGTALRLQPVRIAAVSAEAHADDMEASGVEPRKQIANHASTRTTQLYDRRREELSLDGVERIRV